ncbi:hypothetical protein JCM3774_004029 [Rhodotorula dairenensis]
MGQGQSQQMAPTEEQQGVAVGESSANPLDSSTTPSHVDQDLEAPAGGQDHGEMNHEDSTVPEPTRSHAEANQETAPTPAPETFKVPGLPARPPPQVEAQSTAVPADIAHIMALGANEPEKLDLADLEKRATKVAGSREIADVVQELKANAVMAVDNEARVGAPRGDELEQVEQEMEMRGVKREPMSDGIEQAEEGEIGVDGHVAAEDSAAGDVKMDAGESSSSDSDSDSDSSSSDSDSTMAAPQAVGRQRNRRGRGQRAGSPSDMADDDDDGESGVTSSKTAPKTEHEIAEPEIALPSVQKLDAAVELAKFGKVESVIENVAVIRADTSGDWRVLDEGTVVCWEDRTVIGNIFETFGSVQQPFYSIRFPANAPPDPAVFSLGRPAFYAPNMASFVFTRDLRAIKGSDASNIWDEEVAAHEMEFSDDEEEAEYRRRLKADRRSRTQSATPGPSGAGRNARQSVTPAPHQPSPVPTSLLPARPSVSYADALEPSSFVTSALPTAAPMSAAAGSSSSGSRAAFGDKPPPGQVGRRMFERDSGAALAPGDEVEFEFSSGEGSDSGEEGEERPGPGSGFGRGGATRGGGRGGAGSAPRGGQRERGRGRGRARGEAPRGRGGARTVAPLPSRAGPPGGSGAGLPSRPAFNTDFGPETGVDGPVRMSTGAAGAAAAPSSESSQSFTFGAAPAGAAAAAVPQTDFRFQVAGSPKQAASSSARSPAAPAAAAPRGAAGSASSSPYQQPWSSNDAASSRPTPPASDPQGAAAYGYRPDAYAVAAMQYHPQQPYHAQGPGTGAYNGGGGAYNPAAPYPGPEGAAGGYSPHTPSWNAAAAYRGGAPPVADPRGGHINPRFLPAQQQGQAAFGPPQPPPPSSGHGAAGWYASPAAYGAPPPPPGGPHGNGWW